MNNVVLMFSQTDERTLRAGRVSYGHTVQSVDSEGPGSNPIEANLTKPYYYFFFFLNLFFTIFFTCAMHLASNIM